MIAKTGRLMLTSAIFIALPFPPPLVSRRLCRLALVHLPMERRQPEGRPRHLQSWELILADDAEAVLAVLLFGFCRMLGLVCVISIEHVLSCELGFRFGTFDLALNRGVYENDVLVFGTGIEEKFTSHSESSRSRYCCPALTTTLFLIRCCGFFHRTK